MKIRFLNFLTRAGLFLCSLALFVNLSLCSEVKAEDSLIYSTTRLVRVGCFGEDIINVMVFDEQQNLVASVIDGNVNTDLDHVYYGTTQSKEKVFYLPADGSYTLDICVVGEDGRFYATVGEQNFVFQGLLRLNNWYDIPITFGNRFKFYIPAIEDMDSQGSNVDYALYLDGLKIDSDEEIRDDYYILQNCFPLVSVTREGTGRISGGGSVLKGCFTTLIATPYGNAEFLGWYQDDVLISTEPEHCIVVTEPVSFVAKFSTADSCYLTFESNGNGNILAFDGRFLKDEIMTLKAFPDDGYEFVCWVADGGEFSDRFSAETEYTIIGDASITAFFRKIGCETGDINDDGAVTTADFVKLVSYVLGTGSDSENSEDVLVSGADLNADGEINVQDLLLMKTILTR